MTTPKSLTLAYATLRLLTRVVLVIVSGAVPVAMLDTNLPDVVMFPPVILPLDDKEVNVPTLVMFGCAAVVTVPAVVTFPETLPIILAATVPEIITEVALALIVWLPM